MIRAFKIFEQFLNLFEVWQPQFHRFHDKWLSDWLCRGCQTRPQNAIYDLLERLAAFPHFLFQQGSHVVINGKSSSHIMMLQL